MGIIAKIHGDGTWRVYASLVLGNITSEHTEHMFPVLIDTGTLKTVLSSIVITASGITISSLPVSPVKVIGVNGQYMETWVLHEAGLLFPGDENGIHIERCDELLVVDMPTDDYYGLIGIDILKRFNISSNVQSNQIRMNRVESILSDSFEIIGVRRV